MSNSTPFSELIQAADSRAGLGRLLETLGFEPVDEDLPRPAWTAYGLGSAPDVRRLAVAGRAGTLDALLLETSPGTASDRVAWLARRVRSRNPARMHLFVVASPGYRRLVLGTFGLDDVFRHISLERARLRPADLEALAEMVPANGESGLELALRHARALDRSRVTRSFFREFRSRREAIAGAWTGVPTDAERERAQLALLFLSRLTFLYFLQRRGTLAGDDRYLVNLFGAWAGRPRAGADGGVNRPGTFYRARLQPLFFGALNRRPEDREPAARQLGALPYLNGGLFEPHALERRFPDLDLPDDAIRACFDDLLERYRFTSREDPDHAGFGVDPEILGRVFEGLMEPDTRGETGSFYTPAPVVRRVVREAVSVYLEGTVAPADLPAVVDGRGREIDVASRHQVVRRLERVRVLDPACGSGAFLLGALHRLARTLAGLEGRAEGDVRRELVARSLHGVDLLDDAALLCSLRLWLALSDDDEPVRPLPNLDRRIRQGDALVDPLDLGSMPAGEALRWHPLRDPELRRALRALEPAVRQYVSSGPRTREEARRRVRLAETRLARRWIRGLRTARTEELRLLTARAADRDLFGETPEPARQAALQAPRVRDGIRELDGIERRLEEDGALPFFSFGVHFADAGTGFDFVISNPPWIRSHRWPGHLRAIADRFEVCRAPGWRAAVELTGAPAAGAAQVDLALLFVERSVHLLAAGGVLAVLVPAKSFRALYAAAARRMLLRDLEFALIEDHALDQRAIFRADAFAGVLVGRRPGTGAGRDAEGPDSTGPDATGAEPTGGGGTGGNATGRDPAVRVRLTRPGVDPLEFRVPQSGLPFDLDDPSSPWLLAPPDVRAVFRRMQRAGPPLGRHPGLRVRRGIMTGANDVLLFSSVEPKLGGLSRVVAEGHDRARRAGARARATKRYRGVVETASLRPLVRGADVDAFRYEVSGHVAWCHGPEDEPLDPGPRMREYLEGHRERLEARGGYRSGLPLGAVFRLAPETLRPKVAWHDLSDTLRAVALPATVPFDGVHRELIPLNTVYFLPTDDGHTAEALAGLLNSLPVRTLARALAERAKDSRFRFFAWTVAAMPLSAGWERHRATVEVRTISGAAHQARGIAPADQRRLDRAVAELYGLDPADLEILARFDAWLRGEP